MKFKALRSALAAGFIMTTTVVVGVTVLEHNLVKQTSVSAPKSSARFSAAG